MIRSLHAEGVSIVGAIDTIDIIDYAEGQVSTLDQARL